MKEYLLLEDKTYFMLKKNFGKSKFFKTERSGSQDNKIMLFISQIFQAFLLTVSDGTMLILIKALDGNISSKVIIKSALCLVSEHN